MSEIAYWFRAGLVSVVAGSNVVTGAATYWQNAVMRPSAGDAFSLDGQRWFEISLIETDGKLRVHGTFAATLNNVSYMIKPVVSASPVLRLQAQIADILGQNRTFFTQLNKFWYEPGEVTVTDPFGRVHTHKTLYSLKQGIDEHALQLATMIESATGATQLLSQLGQDVNNLSVTVAGLQGNVDSKLTIATTKANEAKVYRDEALSFRNTATEKADLATAAQLVTTTKASESSSSAATATTKASEAAASASNAGSSASTALTHRNAAEGFKNDASASATSALAHRNAAEGFKTDASTSASTALTHRNAAEGFRNTANTSATNAGTAADSAQKWAAEAEDVVVGSGLFSARHYSLKAQQYAQLTAANTSGGVSFRGFHNPSGGFPVGAEIGHQFKLSGPGTLTFEVEGSKLVSTGDYVIKTAGGWVHLDDATDAVKTSRTINGQALSSNITLTAANVGARPDNWMPTWAQIGYTPIQQGGGTSQGNNTIRIGWGTSQLRLQVDSTDFGVTWPININGNAATVPWSGVSGKQTTLSGYGITDAVALAGDQTIAGNKTFSNQLTAGNLVAVQAVISRPFGGEGGQFVLGYPNAGAVSGQANNTWNIDVDSSSLLRFFRFDNSGNSLIAMTMDPSTGLVTSNFRFRIGANMTNAAGFNLASQGTADPTTLVDGDIWHRSDALFVRLGGASRQLIHNGNPTSLASDVTQAQAEAGTDTARRWFTPERVKQAIAAQAAPKAATQAAIDEAVALSIIFGG